MILNLQSSSFLEVSLFLPDFSVENNDLCKMTFSALIEDDHSIWVFMDVSDASPLLGLGIVSKAHVISLHAMGNFLCALHYFFVIIVVFAIQSNERLDRFHDRISISKYQWCQMRTPDM